MNVSQQPINLLPHISAPTNPALFPLNRVSIKVSADGNCLSQERSLSTGGVQHRHHTGVLIRHTTNSIRGAEADVANPIMFSPHRNVWLLHIFLAPRELLCHCLPRVKRKIEIKLTGKGSIPSKQDLNTWEVIGSVQKTLSSRDTLVYLSMQKKTDLKRSILLKIVKVLNCNKSWNKSSCLNHIQIIHKIWKTTFKTVKCNIFQTGKLEAFPFEKLKLSNGEEGL